MNKLMKATTKFRNKLARHFIVIGMAYVPGISNSSAALFIPCLIASFLTEIGYRFNHKFISSVSPFRMPLSIVIEESSVTCMLDLRMKLSDNSRAFIYRDHDNKEGVYYLVKGLSWWISEEASV